MTNPQHDSNPHNGPRNDPRANHANDNDGGNDNKRKGKTIATAPAAGALTSLAVLGAALNNVDTASVVGRSGLPMMQFKREGDGTFMFGQKRIVPEKGSRWAINPTMFKYGFVSFRDNKVVGERLVSVSLPKPLATKLPDTGSPWQEEWAVNMKCLDGADAGIEVTFKMSTVGGNQAIAGLIEAIRDRLNSGQHDGKVVPIVLLEKSSYQHSQFGRVWTPLLTIVDWMPLDGPAPAPEPLAPPPPPPPPTEQPRRRRVS